MTTSAGQLRSPADGGTAGAARRGRDQRAGGAMDTGGRAGDRPVDLLSGPRRRVDPGRRDRHADRAARDRARTGLPGEPDRELRAGRSRIPPRLAGGRPRRVLGLAVGGRPRHRPARSDRHRCGRRVRARAALPSLVTTGAHGRDHRDHATARSRVAADAATVGPAPDVAADPRTVRCDGHHRHVRAQRQRPPGSGRRPVGDGGSRLLPRPHPARNRRSERRQNDPIEPPCSVSRSLGWRR